MNNNFLQNLFGQKKLFDHKNEACFLIMLDIGELSFSRAMFSGEQG